MKADDVVLVPYALRSQSSSSPPVLRDEPDDSMASDDNEELPSSRSSPVDSYLATTARVHLTCDSCKYTRAHKERFLHLSLEIGPGIGSVEDGLRRFFAPEKRELKCEKCFSESATQTMEIVELPRALIFHFKRFIVDVSDDFSSVSYRKNQSIVAFDEELTLDEDAGGVLNEFLADDCQPPPPSMSGESPVYALRSVVNHMGFSVNCGHYTADAKRMYDNGDRQWTRFNDSMVSRISSEEAIEESQRTAYMVLYEIE